MTDRRPAPLDPQMKAFLESTSDSATKGVDVFTASVAELRAAVERGRIGYAEGGAEMARVEEFWIPGPGRMVVARLNVPTSAELRPVIVQLHGGGWTWNSIYTGDRTARELAASSGCAVLSPDYSLSPEYKFPQALNECIAVLRWVAAHGREKGLDPDRIVVAGDSAGGNLALASAIALRDAGENFLRGALLNYGVFDSDFSRETYDLYGEGDLYLSRRMMQFFWRNYVSSPDQMTHPLAAPFRADLAGLPPLRFQVAEIDGLADENVATAEKAKAAGVEVSMHIYRGLTHGFLRAAQSVDAAAQAIEDGAAWVKGVIG